MTLEVKISKKLIPYKSAFKFLKKRVDSVKIEKDKDLLWILEHPLTFTGGIRSQKNEILDKKIKIIETNRGGKITLHNPGQKVIYFVLNLNNKKKNVRNLVKIVEKSIIELLKLYNIESYADRENIGIWVNGKKIAAIGIRVSQWIAYHGCSINMNNNLNHYKKIIPCGLSNSNITSMVKETRNKLTNIETNLKKIFIKNLKDI
jgi:lipoyl(octanoyl) transferase